MRARFAFFFLSEYIPPSEVVRQQYGERDEEKQRSRTGGRREFSPGNTVSVKKKKNQHKGSKSEGRSQKTDFTHHQSESATGGDVND